MHVLIVCVNEVLIASHGGVPSHSSDTKVATKSTCTRTERSMESFNARVEDIDDYKEHFDFTA